MRQKAVSVTVMTVIAALVAVVLACVFGYARPRTAYGDTANVVAEETVTVKEYTPGSAGFTDEGFTMTDNWGAAWAASCCNDGDAVSYRGTFTRFVFYGEAKADTGIIDVYIDDTKVITLQNNRGNGDSNDNLLYASEILERGEHTFKIECKGGGWINVHKIVIYDDTFVTPYSETIDDADERIVYSSFGGYTDQTGLYNGTVHSTQDEGATATVTLDGVRQAVFYADRNKGRGIAKFYIDDILAETVDLYNGVNCDGSHPIFVSDVLPEGTHTIKMECTGTKNANADTVWVALDKIEAYYHSVPPEPARYFDIDDASLGYEGDGWTAFNGLGEAYYMKSAHSTDKAGASFSIAFDGATDIKIYASKSNDRGQAKVYLNGADKGDIDEYSAVYIDSDVVWESGALEKGRYELKLVTTGAKQAGSGNTWIEIDKIRVEGIEGEDMMINSANKAFITYSSGATLTDNADALCGKYALVPAGQGFTAAFRGSSSRLVPFDGGKSWTAELTVDGVTKTVSSDNCPADGIALDLTDAVMHKIEFMVTEGEFLLNYITTDDVAFVSLEADMRMKALAEIEERVNGTRVVSDPDTWQPVAFAADKPSRGVALTGGVLADMFDKNTEYFEDSIKKTNYVDVTEWWVSMLQNSNEGRVLAGLANTLNWKSVPAFETELAALLGRIRARQQANGNGYALSYDESVLGGCTDPSEDERRNYDRAMFVKGLIAAGNYYHNNGVAIKDNVAYTILREFTDWYNYNEHKYGEHMLEGVVGVQGHPASTYTYFTPVGKTEDMTYAELCYIQDWWLEYLADEIPEAIYKYPLNRPHNYLMTGVDSYLDHYRATGDVKYLNACKGYWNMMHELFMHEGGAAAICEFNTYLPGSRHLDSANHTGELCGTAFWVDFNYKLLRLFPNEEKYALEVEKGIYNILREAQDANGKLRYHQRYNGNIEVALNTNTCCEINGSNLLSRLPEFIYLIDNDGVRVNLYDGSTLDVTVGSKHFALTQTANILSGDVSVIKITGDAMKLTLRVPSWNEGFTVKVNGAVVNVDVPANGGYVTLDVNTGDTVEVNAVKRLKACGYDGLTQVEGKTRYTFMYGPVLIATTVNSDCYYDFKFKVHGKDTDGSDESAIDVNAELDDFIAGLVKTGDAKWAYETDGKRPYLLVPYGELERNTVFSVYPLFGYEEPTPLPPKETVDGNTLDIEFDSIDALEKFDTYSSSQYGLTISGGALVTSANSEHKIMLGGFYDCGTISVALTARMTRGRTFNAGIYFNASRASNVQDKINALNLQVESEGNSVKCNLYRFDAESGYLGNLCAGQFVFVASETLEIELVVKNNKIYGYVGDALALEYELSGQLGLGNVGIRSQHASAAITSFSVTNSEVKPDVPEPADKTELENMLAVASKFDGDFYTENSFAALTAAIASASEVVADPDATIEEVTAATQSLKSAAAGLVKASTTPETPDDGKRKLQSLLDMADAFDGGYYTESSFAALTAAITTAREVVSDSDATIEEVTAATQSLKSATSNLVKISPEKPETKTVTVKDRGMTAGFYVVLSLLAATLVAVGAVIVVKKNAANKH